MGFDPISRFKIQLIDNLKFLNFAVDSRSIKVLNHNGIDILIHCSKSAFDNESIEKINEKCQSWHLKIDNILFKQNQLIIKLNHASTYTQCFRELFNTKTLLSFEEDHQDEVINFIYDADSSLNDLTNYRIYLLMLTARNCANAVGYNVSINESNVNGWYFTHKSNLPKDAVKNHKIVLCGPVINANGNGKEIDTTTEIYKKQIKNILRETENRNNSDDESNEILLDAICKFEFLRVKASSPVKLSSLGSESSATGSAVFVLYNYSRLNAIIIEFENRVRAKYYLPLPSVECVDFSLLKDEKEWTLMFKYIMNFPVVVKESLQHNQERKPSPHLLCTFLFSFTRVISSYYRCTKILMEPKPNILPLIYVRIYLIKAILQILLIGLKLMNVKAMPAL